MVEDEDRAASNVCDLALVAWMLALLPDVAAERARFELANGVRPLRHFQCRALDQTRRPLRSESILSAVPFARTPPLAGGPALEIQGGVDHAEVRQRLGEVAQHLPCIWIEFLGKQPEVVRRFGYAADERLRLIDTAHLGQHVDQPERANDEHALRLMELRLFRAVAVKE